MLELINSAGEQLGQLRLGSVHPEAPLEQLEFFGGEVCGLEPVSDDQRRLILKINHRLPPLTDQAETGCRHQQRRCPSQWLSHGGLEMRSAEGDMKLAGVSFCVGIPADSGYVRQDCIVRPA